MMMSTGFKFIAVIALGMIASNNLSYAQSKPTSLLAQNDRKSLSPEMTSIVDYAHSQRTTGFLIMKDGEILVDENWAPPLTDKIFASFSYGPNKDGALLEDVASQQKSFIAVLMAIAIDKGLIVPEQPVSDYIGKGWSNAAEKDEAKIHVMHLLNMNSGLDERFSYTSPPGSTFFYNTPVYAVTKRILTSVAKKSLDVITREWLTDPLAMTDTEWRQRPSALSGVGNSSGLVTSPRDIAVFGAMVMNNGVSKDGTRIVSEAAIKSMLTPSSTNPAYGSLWWLNSGAYTIRSTGKKSGPLVEAAPSDMVAAMGALDRRLYIVPSKKLIIVRTGAAADRDFDQQLWLRIDANPQLMNSSE